MFLQLRPLFFVGSPGLVKDLGRHVHLAEVVQHGSPTKLVAILVGQAELFGNEVGVGLHPLGVPPGSTIVVIERGDQRQDELSVRNLFGQFASFAGRG